MASGRLQTIVEPALPVSMPSFPDLPIELRQLIWSYSFVPRCIDIRGSHRNGSKLQSRCNNPAALSVSLGAREAALGFYPVKLPLGTIAPYKHHVLYINFTVDTVILLHEGHSHHIYDVLNYLKDEELSTGNCLQRLAISAWWTPTANLNTIRRPINRRFSDLDQITVFIYDKERRPTDGTGGVCALEDFSQTDFYKQDAIEKYQQISDSVKGIRIGKKQVKVMKLTFRHGW